MSTSIRSFTLAKILCLGLALGAGLPSVALAQNDAKIKNALKGAVDDYDMAMLDDARKKLNKGISYATKNKLKGPEVAKLHIMLGIVIFAEKRSKATAEAEFIKALEMDAKAQVPAVYMTPDLKKIFTSAKSKAKPPKQPDTKTKDPKAPKDKDPKSPATFKHTRIAKANAGKPLTVEAFVPKDMAVFKMMVHHRRFGEEKYQSTEMKPTDAVRFVGEIPGNDVRTSQIEYYIEAYDRGNNVIAKVADARDPASILVLGSGNYKAKKTKKPKVSKKPSNKVFTLGIGGGTGFGLIFGGQPTANPFPEPGPGKTRNEVSPGFAAAFGHASLDLGWIINNSMRLGLYFKWQFSPYQDFNAPGFPDESTGGAFPTTRDECLGLGLPGDCLLGLKYKYFFSDKPDEFRVYSSIGLGVGRVRSWIEVPKAAYVDKDETIPTDICRGKTTSIDPDSKFTVCKLRDTVRTGWLHLGIGSGITVPLNEYIEFYGDTYLMFVTLDQGGVHMDVTMGFNFNF